MVDIIGNLTEKCATSLEVNNKNLVSFIIMCVYGPGIMIMFGTNG